MARLEIERHGREVIVTLSRRNLLALLHKLDTPGSAREIQNDDCRIEGVWTSEIILILRCEDDEEHYAERLAPPGPMHPDTERFIADNREREW